MRAAPRAAQQPRGVKGRKSAGCDAVTAVTASSSCRSTTNAANCATFADSAPDIGRHVRGLLFVGYSPDLTVVWRQRIALQDDTDAVDTDALFPEFASLLTTASIGRLPTVA